MFDLAGRFIVCNKRYSEIYNLPSDFAKPGCTIRDLLEYRGAAGTFSENPDQYIDDLYAKIAQKNTTSTMTTLSDGRTIAVVNQPMRGRLGSNTRGRHGGKTTRGLFHTAVQKQSRAYVGL